jgi:hypothetical protein
MSDGAIHSRRGFLRNAAMTLGATGSTSAQVAYAEAGPANGPAVVLLHGWPYDIHS